MRRLTAVTGMVALLAVSCTSGGEEAVEPLVAARSTQPAPGSTVSSGGDTIAPTTSTSESVVDASTDASASPTSQASPTFAATTVAPMATVAPVVATAASDDVATSSTSAPTRNNPPQPGAAPASVNVNQGASTGQSAPVSGNRSVDPAGLVDAANMALSTTTTTTTLPCGTTAADRVCTPAARPPLPPPSPNPGVSVGEYQRNVPVEPTDRLDIYFDQSKSTFEMEQICVELGGRFTQRLDDGSPWAGWYYCEDVDH